MYVYDESCEKNMDLIHFHQFKSQAFFLQELVRNSSEFAMTSSYDEACISVSVISKKCFQNLEKNEDWDNGSNHVFVINSQYPNDLPFGGYIPRTSYKAIFAQTFQMKCWYRQGYDISVPLSPKFQANESLRGLLATCRKFFVTFKGKFYMKGRGDSRLQLLKLQNVNSTRVIIDVQCHMHAIDKIGCPPLQKRNSNYSFQDLLNTTFALVPEGRQPSSYRLAEVMSAGCIPVFVASDQYVRPFEDEIDWNSISVSFEPEKVDTIMVKLSSYTADQILGMQKHVILTYNRFLASSHVIGREILRTISKSINKTAAS